MTNYIIKDGFDVSIKDSNGRTIIKTNSSELKDDKTLQGLVYPTLMDDALNTVLTRRY